eukprot:CAMPEP_0184698890 /NCGR_PEP_ID=MMETSP0313-20130426/5342_1 /TAXON_ID=2792 /ORGANISM="Porphyridium aerugineum, Strain SAG 1380-2" /LENGTH=533 /DNA_ID=CAMNT_0027157887 /DNA_START=622 /DNA_END=2223 /DNA_ORIENTATION=-
MSSPNTRDDDQESDSNDPQRPRGAQYRYDEMEPPAANVAPIPQYNPGAPYFATYRSQAAPMPQTYQPHQVYQPHQAYQQQQAYYPQPPYPSTAVVYQQPSGGQQPQQPQHPQYPMWGQGSAPQTQPTADSIALSSSYYGYGAAGLPSSSPMYGPSGMGRSVSNMPPSINSPMQQPFSSQYPQQDIQSPGGLGPVPFRGYQTNTSPAIQPQQSPMHYSGPGFLPRIAADDDSRGYRRIPVSFLLNESERTQPLPPPVQISQPPAQSSPDGSGGTRGSTGDNNKKKKIPFSLPPISSIKKTGHGLESASFISPVIHPSPKDSTDQVQIGPAGAAAPGNRSETSGPMRQLVGPGSSSADTGPVRKRWSPQEDEIVIQGVINLKTWDEIAAMLPTGRTASQVRLRYQNYLQFSNNARRSLFTKEEDNQILAMASKKRRKWSELAKTMGRSHVSVKNRMYFLTRERKNTGKAQRAPSTDSAGNPVSGSGKDGSDGEPLSDYTGDDELGDDEEDESDGDHERDDKTQTKGSKDDKSQNS